MAVITATPKREVIIIGLEAFDFIIGILFVLKK